MTSSLRPCQLPSNILSLRGSAIQPAEDEHKKWVETVPAREPRSRSAFPQPDPLFERSRPPRPPPRKFPSSSQHLTFATPSWSRLSSRACSRSTPRPRLSDAGSALQGGGYLRVSSFNPIVSLIFYYKLLYKIKDSGPSRPRQAAWCRAQFLLIILNPHSALSPSTSEELVHELSGDLASQCPRRETAARPS